MRWKVAASITITWVTFFILFQHDIIEPPLWWWGLTKASHTLNVGSTTELHSQSIYWWDKCSPQSWAGSRKWHWTFAYCKWSQQELIFFLFGGQSVSIEWKLNSLMVYTWKHKSVSCEILLPWNGCFAPMLLPWFSHWRSSSGCITAKGQPFQ